MEREEATFLRAVREAVMGYVLQDASPLEIVNVVRAVGSGDAAYPPCFSATILQFAAQQLASMPDLVNRTQAGLSRREQQLVELVQLGLTNKEIGLRLNLAERTVKNHLHRIFRKVNVRDRMTMVERTRSGDSIAV
jgi:DNA-binding NarL/FixJ family response regulator